MSLAFLDTEVFRVRLCSFFIALDRIISGSLHRRPSGIVEKILNTLKEREKENQRNCTSLPRDNQFDSSSIPARFKRMDPQRPTFSSLVTQISKAKEEEKVEHKSFKSMAKSLLSPENRVCRKEQIDQNKRRATQLLIMGGKSFLVDEEGKVEEEVGEKEDR